ncbi:MAG: hypothetical protein ABSC95_30870 [Acetobacteraceae bacterium]|jgi:hypothetical protein
MASRPVVSIDCKLMALTTLPMLRRLPLLRRQRGGPAGHAAVIA